MNGIISKTYFKGLEKILAEDVSHQDMELWLKTQEVTALMAIVDMLSDLVQVTGAKLEMPEEE